MTCNITLNVHADYHIVLASILYGLCWAHLQLAMIFLHSHINLVTHPTAVEPNFSENMFSMFNLLFKHYYMRYYMVNFDWFLHVRMPNFPCLILQSFLGFMHIYRTCMFNSLYTFNLSINLSSYRFYPFVVDATKLGKKILVQVNVTSPSDGVINPLQERLLFQMK